MTSIRVLVSADMEGAAGAATSSDVTQGTRAWAEVRRSWTEEVNTVLEALFDCGVDEVLLVDAHGDGANFEPDMIDPRASFVRGAPRTFGMLEGIDSGVHAAASVAPGTRYARLFACRRPSRPSPATPTRNGRSVACIVRLLRCCVVRARPQPPSFTTRPSRHDCAAASASSSAFSPSATVVRTGVPFVTAS